MNSIDLAVWIMAATSVIDLVITLAEMIHV
jgi:hypothetical protein